MSGQHCKSCGTTKAVPYHNKCMACIRGDVFAQDDTFYSILVYGMFDGADGCDLKDVWEKSNPY